LPNFHSFFAPQLLQNILIIRINLLNRLILTYQGANFYILPYLLITFWILLVEIYSPYSFLYCLCNLSLPHFICFFLTKMTLFSSLPVTVQTLLFFGDLDLSSSEETSFSLNLLFHLINICLAIPKCLAVTVPFFLPTV